jgi:hypothetical protein
LGFFLSKLAIYIDPFIGFVISDREKGLKKAVSKNFMAPQYHCQRHVMSNKKKIQRYKYLEFSLADICAPKNPKI